MEILRWSLVLIAGLVLLIFGYLPLGWWKEVEVADPRFVRITGAGLIVLTLALWLSGPDWLTYLAASVTITALLTALVLGLISQKGKNRPPRD